MTHDGASGIMEMDAPFLGERPPESHPGLQWPAGMALVFVGWGQGCVVFEFEGWFERTGVEQQL